MSKLIILRGVSGSGKSTWAENQSGVVVVSRDKIRTAFFPMPDADYYKSPILRDMEDSVTRIQDAAIEQSLKAGQDVIVDNTNIEWKYVKALAKIGNRVGAEVEIKVFDVPLNIALSRNAQRAALGGRNVPEDVIRKQHSRFQGNKTKELEPVISPITYSGTPGKPRAFLVDIDGTLAHHNNARSPYDWKRVGEDTVDEVVAEVVSVLGSSNFAMDLGHYTVVVMSGRDGSCREETKEWLDKHDIIYDALFMRDAGDMRADNIVKAELFDTCVRDNYDVRFVIDDRRQVCDMWLSMGLKVFNVSGLDKGEF